MTEEQLRQRVISQDKIIEELVAKNTVQNEMIDQLLESNREYQLALARYQIGSNDES